MVLENELEHTFEIVQTYESHAAFIQNKGSIAL